MFYFNFKDKECSLKIKLIQDLFVILYTVLSFKTIPIILVILRKTIIFAHSDA